MKGFLKAFIPKRWAIEFRIVSVKNKHGEWDRPIFVDYHPWYIIKTFRSKRAAVRWFNKAIREDQEHLNKTYQYEYRVNRSHR